MVGNVAAIIQARMGSTRLPGKVLKPIMDKPMLAYLLERLNRCKELNEIIIATTMESKDDVIIDFLRPLNIRWFRGSEEDVLARYYKTAQKYNVDTIVRITADCPLISPQVTDKVIRSFKDSPLQKKYASNTLKRSYPRGLDTEVFSFELLEDAFFNARDSVEREHVTPFIWRQPNKFDLIDVVDLHVNSHLRWTVDTEQDFELVQRIYEALYTENPNFTYEDILSLVQRQPDLTEINRNVEQKRL